MKLKKTLLVLILLMFSLSFIFSKNTNSKSSVITSNINASFGIKGIGGAGTINMYYFFEKEFANSYHHSNCNSALKSNSISIDNQKSKPGFSLGLWSELTCGGLFKLFDGLEYGVDSDGNSFTDKRYIDYFYVGTKIGLGFVEEINNKLKLYEGVGLGVYYETASYHGDGFGLSVSFDFMTAYYFTNHFGFDFGTQIDLLFFKFGFNCVFNPYLGLAIKF